MHTDQTDTTTTRVRRAAGRTKAALKKRKERSFNYRRNATFSALLVGYAGYYICRQNFGVALGPMQVALGLNPITFGAISSVGTLFYAVGKVTNGALADRFGGRAMFFIGLVGSVVATVAFGLSSGVALFFVLWACNRFFQSMGWGGLVNVLSRWFSKHQYGTAMGVMSLNYQFGSVLASLFCGALLSAGFGWRGLFFIPALVLLAVGVLIRPFFYNPPSVLPSAVKADQVEDSSFIDADLDDRSVGMLFKSVLADRKFLVMCGLSFVLTLLRECFSLWMPQYFAQLGAGASTAAFKSTIFPLLGCVGTIGAGWVSDRYHKGRRAPVMATLMVGLFFSLLALSRLDAVALAVNVSRDTLALVLVGSVGFFLLGPYSLVGGVAALDFGGTKAAGTASGVLDGVGYLGATLAGIGVASIVVARGWSSAYSLMAICTAIGIVFCAMLWNVKPK